MVDERIILVQLADIHFHDGSEKQSDLDQDVRNELERDLEQMRELLGPAHEVLVAGDIAYAARPAQYTTAGQWLTRLREQSDCENIAVVPGNHDVDRGRIKGQGHLLLRKLREDIRSAREPSDAETKFQEYLEDDMVRPALYGPLEEFNKFAKVYGCHTGPDQPHWQRDLLMNDRSTLRLYGLNSVLISDDKDHWRDHRLILGKRQCQLPNEPGVTYLTLCHHPPDWLLDQARASRILNGRAAIQLYGHTHSQWIEQTDQSLRITSGATHPDRKEDGWQPRYNYLSLAIEGTDQNRRLDVRVYSRVWSEQTRGGSFMADHAEDGSIYRHYQLKLAGWSGPKVTYSPVERSKPAPSLLTKPQTDSSDEPQRPSNKMSPQRRLTYQYLGLPYLQQIKIAQDLDLLMNEDQGIDDVELFGRIYSRAKQQGKLARLWDAIVGDAANPFKS